MPLQNDSSASQRPAYIADKIHHIILEYATLMLICVQAIIQDGHQPNFVSTGSPSDFRSNHNPFTCPVDTEQDSTC